MLQHCTELYAETSNTWANGAAICPPCRVAVGIKEMFLSAPLGGGPQAVRVSSGTDVTIEAG